MLNRSFCFYNLYKVLFITTISCVLPEIQGDIGAENDENETAAFVMLTHLNLQSTKQVI